MAKHKVTVQQAADVLDTSVDAVRQRIKRGKLPRAEADDPTDNRVYVWLDGDQPEARHQIEDEASVEVDALVETLREQVAYLRGVIATRDQELALRAEEIRRRDTALEREQHLTAMFAERLRALEAPVADDAQRSSASEAEDAPQSAVSPGPARTPPDPSEGPQTATERPEERRSWWQRMFGG
jgi:hypothetical protein